MRQKILTENTKNGFTGSIQKIVAGINTFLIGDIKTDKKLEKAYMDIVPALFDIKKAISNDKRQSMSEEDMNTQDAQQALRGIDERIKGHLPWILDKLHDFFDFAKHKNGYVESGNIIGACENIEKVFNDKIIRKYLQADKITPEVALHPITINIGIMVSFNELIGAIDALLVECKKNWGKNYQIHLKEQELSNAEKIM